MGAPESHGAHYLFGYRYLVFSVVALWCFSERLRSGDRRWMFAAGAIAGIALVFRLTPAVAVVAGIGAGTLVAQRDWRGVFEDAFRFGVAFLATVGPVLAWLLYEVGAAALWNEIVVRPIVMTDLQSLPVPALDLPTRDRVGLRTLVVNLQFRIYPVLYAGYALFLLFRGIRDKRAGRPFESPLLLAVVVWGGLYLSRAFGRADEAHLDSVLPAACLLMAHAWGAMLRAQFSPEGRAHSPLRIGVAFAASFSLWVFLTCADIYVRHAQQRASVPIRAVEGRIGVSHDNRYLALDPLILLIRNQTAPTDVILDLSASPLVHVLSGRRGAGGHDMIMPGTFPTPLDEQIFIARLEAKPPKLVILPRWTFDLRRSRSVFATAPVLMAWVGAHYELARDYGEFTLMLPRP